MTINLKYVARLQAVLLALFCLSMLIPLGFSIFHSWIYQPDVAVDHEVVVAFVMSMCVGLIVSAGFWFFSRGHKQSLGRREALLLVSVSWFVLAGVGALPFFLWAQMHDHFFITSVQFSSFIDAYFESMSGLTTTGATILTDIEAIPKGLLLWRSLIHWLGGLGIVVIFVAILPSLGGESKRLFSIESTGFSNQGVTLQVKDTARQLLFIYVSLTLFQIFAMMLVDSSVGWFNAVNHAFSSIATGGYSTLNASAGGFSPQIQWLLVIFMFAGGVNFALYQRVFNGHIRTIIKDTEFRVYLSIILIATLVIFTSIIWTQYDSTQGSQVDPNPLTYLRDALFQSVAIQTTTGFCTVNFEQWPVVAKLTLLFVMFVGGCGGSTSGGIKVIRIISAFKILLVELEKAFRPNVVRPVRVGHHSVEERQRLTIVAYVLGIVVLCGVGALTLILFENDISGTTAITAAVSALNNIGPAFGAVGAVENFGWFSGPSKLALCIMMAIGRLEVYAVLVILLPKFWKSR